MLLVMTPYRGAVHAQSPFTDCYSRTDTQAIVMIPSSNAFSLDENQLPKGAEIAVYTPDEQCVGRVTWRGTGTAFVAWGDDSQTQHKDGFAIGEAISFRVWDPSRDRVYKDDNLVVSFSNERDFYESEGVFRDGGIYTIEGLEGASGTGATRIRALYPNPATDHVMITFTVRETHRVRIQIFDVLGRLHTTLIDRNVAEGDHTLRWDLHTEKAISSGMYFIRLETSATRSVEKVMIVR
jgi:hypothetical protein